MRTERKNPMRTTSGIRAAVFAAASLLAGCADSPITAPPGESFDVDGAGRANTTVNGLVSGLAMSSVAAIGSRMPTELGAATAISGLPETAAPGIANLALRLLRSLPAAGGPLTVQVIRPAVLGRTYIYSPAERRYVPDATRTGAPANGVRFILYALDPGTHDPLVSLETGYADLTDQEPPGLAVGLRFRAVSSGRTFLDYALTLTPTFTGGILGVNGFLADETNRLDFTIGATGQAIGSSQAAQVTFELSVPSQEFEATGSINATGSGGVGSAHVDIEVAIGSDEIRLTGESSATVVNATLTVNGDLFAVITGNPHHPTVRGEGGRELTAAETLVLAGLVGVIYGTVELFEHLLEPVAVLLGISIAL